MAPEWKPYLYIVGEQKKRELFVISQAIRCRSNPCNVHPNLYVQKLYLKDIIPTLISRADKILRIVQLVTISLKIRIAIEATTSPIGPQPLPLCLPGWSQHLLLEPLL